MRKYAILFMAVVMFCGCLKVGKVENPSGDANISRWHTLGLGQSLNIGETTRITRVPGGWVIHLAVRSYGSCCAFIPYSDEGKRED